MSCAVLMIIVRVPVKELLSIIDLQYKYQLQSLEREEDLMIIVQVPVKELLSIIDLQCKYQLQSLERGEDFLYY